jgi:hypothetical protein
MFGDWTAYHVAIVGALALVFGAWGVGAVVGSHKAETTALRGLVLVLALAAVAWLFWGAAPVPESILAIGRSLMR